MRALAALVLVLAACGDGGPPEPPDAAAPDAAVCVDPPSSCDGDYQSLDDCPTIQDLCTPDACGSFDCCYCANGAWQVEFIDCFEGC